MHSRLRVVHLLDPAVCGAEGVMACAACLAIRDVEQHVWIVGGSADARLAASLGVPSGDRVPMTAGLTETGAWSLRALARARLNEADVAETVVQAWSLAGLGLARLVFKDRFRRVGLFMHGPDAVWRTALGRRRRRFAMKGAAAWATTGPLADAWRRAGVRIGGAVDLPAAPGGVGWLAADREAVRAALGVEPSELAVLLLADPPTAGDARSAAALLGMMRYTGPSITGLMHEDSAEMRRAARFIQRFGRHWELIRFRGSVLHAMAAADLVLWDSLEERSNTVERAVQGGAMLASAACAAGIPVVAVRSGLTEHVLGHMGGSLLADDGLMPSLGAKLMPLMDSASRRAEVGTALSLHANERWAASGFVRQVRAIWEGAGDLARPAVAAAEGAA